MHNKAGLLPAKVRTKITSLYRNWNYSAPDTASYERYRNEIDEFANSHKAFTESRSAERASQP